MIKAYGASVILIDGSLDDCIKYVEKYNTFPFYHLNQYDNINNAKAQEITGYEIAMQTSVDYLVSAIGTTGTIMGCARMLKRFNRDIRVIGVTHHMEDKIPGLKNMTYQRIPKIYDKNIIDEIKYVSSSNAKQTVRYLAKKEGLFVGISSGAAMYVALQIARNIKKGNIVVILPDNGNRYLTTDVFNC
jgi:cysteine synthase